MKLFQKTYPLVGIILLLYGGSFFAENKKKDEKLTLITDTYLEVFSRPNLFAEKTDTGSWYKMLDELQKYVYKNASDNKTLLEAFVICRDISYQLINTYKLTYNSVFAGSGWPSQATIATARTNISKLEVAKNLYLSRASANLKNTFYFWQKKKDVKEVLLRLMLMLEHVIPKLRKGFDEWVI